MVGKVLFVLLLFFGTNLKADTVYPPVCFADGYRIRFYPTSSFLLLLQYQSSVAVATKDKDGRPTVLYDENILSKYPIEFRNFTFYHECAHHEQDHIVIGQSDEERRLKEIEADCIAAERLVTEDDYGLDELEIIKSSILDGPVNFDDGGGVYQTAHDRIDNIFECAR